MRERWTNVLVGFSFLLHTHGTPSRATLYSRTAQDLAFVIVLGADRFETVILQKVTV